MSNGRSSTFMHPIAVCLYTISLFAAALGFSHPVYLVALLIIVAIHFFLTGFFGLSAYLKLAASLGLFFCVVNVLAAGAGETMIWKGRIIPWIGWHVDLSVEEVAYQMNMFLHILLLSMLLCLCWNLQDPDRTLSFFSRLAPNSVLTIALTVLSIPNLKERLTEAQMVLRMRGALLGDPRLFKRWNAHLPLLKIMLLSALEDSWQTAEALYARAYGTGRHSHYEQFRWHWRDTWTVTAAGIIGGVMVHAWLDGSGRFVFYPRMNFILAGIRWDMLGILLIAGCLVPIAILRDRIWGQNR